MQIKSDLTQRDVEAFQDAVAELSGAVISRDPAAVVAALSLFHTEIVKLKPTAEQYHELGQRFMEAERERSGKLTAAASNRIYVLAGVRAGIVEGVDTTTLGEQSPGAIMRMAQTIIKTVNASFEVPGE